MNRSTRDFERIIKLFFDDLCQVFCLETHGIGQYHNLLYILCLAEQRNCYLLRINITFYARDGVEMMNGPENKTDHKIS